MKKISAFLDLFIGIFFITFSQLEINNNYRYTWTKPYTDHELFFLGMFVIGIILSVFGVIVFIADIYTSRTIRDVYEADASTRTCPVCKISVDSETAICPKCGYNFEIKNQGET